MIKLHFKKAIKDQKLGSSLPVELFEPGKNRERYQALKKELEKKKKIPCFKEAHFITLEECENILETTKQYYQQVYGKFITSVPFELDSIYYHNQVFL